MNSARTLADRFRTQRTDRIRVDGVEVLSMVEVDLAVDEVVELVVEQARDDVVQLLNARPRRGELVALADEEHRDDGFDHDEGLGYQHITMVGSSWSRAELTGSDPDGQTIQIWNSWSIADCDHSWIGNSGIVCEKLDAPEGASQRMRLWCSDGLGDPQFDDLVVVLTVGPRPSAEVAGSEEE